MFAEAIEDILRDRCTPAEVRAIEQGGDAAPLWRSFAEAGFLDLLRSEEEGGAGLPLPELYAVIAQFGRYAAPLPFAESIAARALVAPGVALPEGPLTLAPALARRADGSLHAPLVPFGTVAQHVLAAEGDKLVLLSCAGARRVSTGIAHGQAATLVWADDRSAERVAGDAAGLAPLAAALYAAMLAGAMTRVFEMTLQYCNERSQFGRTLGKFQAIQHQLAVMAELVAASGIAAESAFQADGRVPRLLPAAIAKARASEAAPEIANSAHALHGAIGVTEEYDLQLFTRRLHEMRIAHGAESHWNRIVGEQVLAGSATLAEFVRAV
jgi:alkylation response protein AidB-like acyl-CoA dehydrogenase